MKAFIWAIACGLSFSTFASAQDTYEKVLDEMIPAFTKFGDTLATIKDRKVPDETKQTLKDLARKMADLKERADKLGEPKGEKKDELEKKYKGKLQDAAKKMSTEMVRIATQVEGGQEIVKEISETLGPLSKKKQ